MTEENLRLFAAQLQNRCLVEPPLLFAASSCRMSLQANISSRMQDLTEKIVQETYVQTPTRLHRDWLASYRSSSCPSWIQINPTRLVQIYSQAGIQWWACPCGVLCPVPLTLAKDNFFRVQISNLIVSVGCAEDFWASCGLRKTLFSIIYLLSSHVENMRWDLCPWDLGWRLWLWLEVTGEDITFILS